MQLREKHQNQQFRTTHHNHQIQLNEQNHRNGDGGEEEANCGVVVASRRFQIAIFQKNYQNGVRDTFNFHFLLCFPKNGVKRSKNPSLDDSRSDFLTRETYRWSEMVKNGQKLSKMAGLALSGPDIPA